MAGHIQLSLRRLSCQARGACSGSAAAPAQLFVTVAVGQGDTCTHRHAESFSAASVPQLCFTCWAPTSVLTSSSSGLVPQQSSPVKVTRACAALF